MNLNLKKTLIITAIVVVVVIGILLCLHYFPFWVNLTNVIVLVVGMIVGWIARVLYAKYILNYENN